MAPAPRRAKSNDETDPSITLMQDPKCFSLQAATDNLDGLFFREWGTQSEPRLGRGRPEGSAAVY